MHFELPQSRLDTLKQFLRHYLMIVLSILTALGLEQVIVSVHEKNAAREASEQIEAEIRANLADIRDASERDDAQSKVLAKVRDMVAEGLKARQPDATIEATILQATREKGFNLNLQWPTLRHEAWDVAVTNQSASWIPADKMKGYSAAYAYQRDASNGITSDIHLLIDGPRLIDTLTDLRSDTVDPRSFLHVAGQMTIMLNASRDNLRELQKHLEEALAHDGQTART
jgi:hypothetical protein